MANGQFAAETPAAINEQFRSNRTTYERIAPVYDILDGLYELSWKRKLRAELLTHARGRLLDAGVGTGCNMPFYPADTEVVGIDASPRMLRKARERAGKLGLDVDLREMNLLSLAFDDASFDTITITFVLICLPDELQEPALRELKRVLKPDGEILILDYHRSSKQAVRWWTRVVSGWLRWAFHARFDASTEEFVEAAGFRIEERQSYMGDGVYKLILRHA